MKSKIVVFSVAVIAFIAACKTAQIEYVKYDNEAAVPRMSAADTKKEVDAGNAILVDSRDKASFDAERLPGAINIASASATAFDKLPKGKKIIVYCSWAAENSSASLALKMNQAGIPGTYAMLGGPPAWKNLGYPVESNKPPVESSKPPAESTKPPVESNKQSKDGANDAKWIDLDLSSVLF